jgi:hypothetical protein
MPVSPSRASSPLSVWRAFFYAAGRAACSSHLAVNRNRRSSFTRQAIEPRKGRKSLGQLRRSVPGADCAGAAGIYCGARLQKHPPARAIKWMLVAAILFVAASYLRGIARLL